MEGFLIAYNVSEEDENLPPIRHMSSLVLNVHERSISLQRTSSTDIVFELFSQMFVSSIPVKWSGDSNVNFYEERILSKDGTGEIAVQLGLFSNAKEAHIEFDLSSEEAVDIYGIVAASTDVVEVSTFTSLIFLVKEPERRLKVNPVKIPLCRSVVAAPLDSYLFSGHRSQY